MLIKLPKNVYSYRVRRIIFALSQIERKRLFSFCDTLILKHFEKKELWYTSSSDFFLLSVQNAFQCTCQKTIKIHDKIMQL